MAIHPAFDAAVRAALDRLSTRDREVLVMRYLEQLSTREIAAALCTTEGAIKVRHLRALERLQSIREPARFGAFRKIALPLTLPGIAATLGFVFTAAWSELLFALMLISKTDKSTFPVGLLSFVSKFSVDFGQMMAAGVIALVPAFLFFVFIQKYLVRGLTAGAVKG